MLEDNVMESVIDRINNMDRLHSLIKENEENWNIIDSSIENLFKEFATLVKKHV